MGVQKAGSLDYQEGSEEKQPTFISFKALKINFKISKF